MDSLKLADDESILGPEDSASMFGGHNNSYPDPGVDYAYNRPMGAQIPRGIQTRRGPPSVLPAPLDNESLSPTQVQVIPETFVYKLKDEDTGKVHRIVSSTTSLQELSESVRVKLGWPPHDTFSLCPDSARISTSTISLSYVDDEGDYVHLSTDTDLADAVAVAISMRWQRLILSVDAQRMRQQMTAISDITGIASRLLGQRSHLKNQRHLYSDTVSDCDSQGVATAPAGPVPALGSPNASSAGGGTVSVSTGSATGRVSGSTSPVVQQPQSVTMFGNPDRSPILRHASPVLRHRLPPHFPPSFAHMPPSHFEGMKAEDVQKRDEIAMIAGAGVAVVCAFLLGRMFKV
ncbi:hypothetical protein BJ742DRAFT_30619 [Cladochytrium replicatum]|nr:hypothetical protein BJ742DRAFT_30619 [Cladochytrium replicatum]